MGIGSFGFSEMLVIVVLVLIFFGPQRMPEIARGLGKAMREFRKSMNEVKRELEQAGMADDSRASQQDQQPRPSGTIEPPHMTAGAPPTGGPPDTAETPVAGSPAATQAEADAEPAPTGAPAGEPGADPAQSSTAVDDSPPPTTPVDEPAATAAEESVPAAEDSGPAAEDSGPVAETSAPQSQKAPAPSDPPA